MPVLHDSVFTGQMPFLSPNQECQSTEGIKPDINPTGKPPHEFAPTLRNIFLLSVNFYDGLDLQI